MDVKKVLSELKKEYPKAKIVQNDKKNPTEIVCEVDPAEKHSQYSAAVAVIDKTEPHSHLRGAEIYYVVRGKLELMINSQRMFLNEDEYRVIPPNTIHYALGKETWVLVYSEPGWNEEDHILVKEKPLSFVPRLTHIRLLVSDYAKMYEFYKNDLGLTLSWGEKTGNYSEFDLGDASIGLFKKKLMAEVLPQDIAKDIIQNRNRVLVNLKVEDVEQSTILLKERKIKFLTEPKVYEAWGIKAAHLEDPDGNIIEIYQDLK